MKLGFALHDKQAQPPFIRDGENLTYILPQTLQITRPRTTYISPRLGNTSERHTYHES